MQPETILLQMHHVATVDEVVEATYILTRWF
jgi:hypothetical protein